MKPNLKNFIVAFIILSLIACNGTPGKPVQSKKNVDTIKPLAANTQARTQLNPGDDSLLLQKAIDSLFKRPKVKALNISINKNPSLKHKLSILTAGTPADEQPYYWLKVGEDTPDNFVTIYHFHVYLHPLKIMNYDVINDEEIGLDEWEKKRINNRPM